MAASAFDLPVPWRDSRQQGLNGVVEIHSSNLPTGRREGARVRDVIALLNKKLQDASPNANTERVVTHLKFHGVRVRSNFPLEHLVPELTGSSPRLLATTKTQMRRTRGVPMMLFVQTLRGKTATIDCTSTDTVNCIKTKIEIKEGTLAENQNVMYAGKQLRDDLTLAFYNIGNESTLHLSLRMLGGAGTLATPRTFADVSDGSIITAIEFSPQAPEWRVCSKGLNIEGRCKNSDCRAFRHMIIDRKHFEVFNLIRDDDIRCPICRHRVTPVTCGLYDCTWRYEGIKAVDEASICSRWKDARGYVYHRFTADENDGSVEWSSLVMTVKPIDEAGDMCSICWSPFGSPVKRSATKTLCGHNFHRSCSGEWAKWCKHNHTQPSCPICRRST